MSSSTSSSSVAAGPPFAIVPSARGSARRLPPGARSARRSAMASGVRLDEHRERRLVARARRGAQVADRDARHGHRVVAELGPRPEGDLDLALAPRRGGCAMLTRSPSEGGDPRLDRVERRAVGRAVTLDRARGRARAPEPIVGLGVPRVRVVPSLVEGGPRVDAPEPRGHVERGRQPADPVARGRAAARRARGPRRAGRRATGGVSASGSRGGPTSRNEGASAPTG